jgi:hypothetical protein
VNAYKWYPATRLSAMPIAVYGAAAVIIDGDIGSFCMSPQF